MNKNEFKKKDIWENFKKLRQNQFAHTPSRFQQNMKRKASGKKSNIVKCLLLPA